MLDTNHDYWMNLAFREAQKAYQLKEVPVGAVIVWDNRVIAKGHNLIEKLQDPTAHAEIMAITAAAEHLGSRRLLDTTIYVTLEPCAMCAGAIVLARIPTLVFGTRDPKSGACGSIFNIVQEQRLNHQVEIVEGVLQNKCSLILADFFKKLRDVN